MPEENVKDRYAREAKARLASRAGDRLAEEFTSVASATDLNVVNVAELMYAAYLMGAQDAEKCATGTRRVRQTVISEGGAVYQAGRDVIIG